MNKRCLPISLLVLVATAILIPGEVLAKEEDPDGFRFRVALSLFADGRHEDVLLALNPLTSGSDEGAWFRKARFLHAAALIELRRFEEAEGIYASEAERLLGEARKHEIAGVILEFADALAKKPDPEDPGATPPDFQKAWKLYRRTLEMEIGRGLRDEVMFKSAGAIRSAGNHSQAVTEFQAYLAEFDPDWTGPVGSAGRISGLKKENPSPAGRHIFDARYQLAIAQLSANMAVAARQNLEDLLVLLGEADTDKSALAADIRWQMAKSFRVRSPSRELMERGIGAARDFLEHHRNDPRSVVVAWWIPETLRAMGRSDEAVAAYAEFSERKTFSLPEGDAGSAKIEEVGKSPLSLHEDWRKLALYLTARIRFNQKNFEEAIGLFRNYVTRFPNGPHWSHSQRGIVDAEFQIGIDAVADKDYDTARKTLRGFLSTYPLDDRARRILFTLGQIHYAEAERLHAEESTRAAAVAEYRAAIEEWSRLVSKYPNTEESSLALYRTAFIQEEKFGDLPAALASYRRLTWGSWASHARARVAAMTAKNLALLTERKFRTSEEAEVVLNLRNIEKLTVKQYFVDLEAYFRKTHAIRGVEDLDIALIQPDKTWEVKVENYRKYAPLEQRIGIPLPKGRPGVCLINVSEEDFEATTLVVRSDLELIVKSSRRELLVFAEDMRKNAPAARVNLLLSDGKKVFATGVTARDGVYRGTHEELKNLGDVRIFAVSGGSIASNTLGLSGLRFGKGLTPRGYIYSDRPAYLPGQEVGIRGIIRDVADDSYSAPAGKLYVISVTDSRGRLVWADEVALSEFGSFAGRFHLADGAPLGAYVVTAKPKAADKPVHRGQFLVQQFVTKKMRIGIELDQEVYFRGETVKATFTAEYYWGEPVAGARIKYHLPDGRSFLTAADAKGRLEVPFDTTGMTPGSTMIFHASIEGEDLHASKPVALARLGFSLKVNPSRELALAGEPFDVKVATVLPDKKPVSRRATLFVLRRETPKSDLVLSGVPWINLPARPSAEVTVGEYPVVTDADTGEAVVRLTLNEGGRYILRVSGEDRFGQVVASEGSVLVSDAEDKVKLRFFSESDTLKVGAATTVRLHSRVDDRYAVLTFDAESILSHRIVKVAKGMNELKLDVGHEHFPNFRIAAALMDGDKLRTASKPFRVERELKVTVRPVSEVFAPGEEGKVELTVTDHLGHPVKAELSLSLVDEALFAIYPDLTAKILDFFQRDAFRHTEFRYTTTCGFKYPGKTTAVVKAFQDEQARQDRVRREAEQIRGLRQELQSGQAAMRPAQTAELMDQLEELEKQDDAPAVRRLANRVQSLRWGGGGIVADRKQKKEAGEAAPREELPSAGYWVASVVTGEDGKATVTVPMPETTTKWRLTARGATVETLVGEATGNVTTREDFFVTLKTPASLMEGDRIRVLARLHDLTGYEGNADVKLEVFRGEHLDRKLIERTATAKITKEGTVEVLLPEVLVPAEGRLRVVVTATAGEKRDAISRTLSVRPWGLSFAAHGGGSARGDAAVTLTLPAGKKYTSRWLTVSVGPNIERALVDMALGSPPRGGIDRFPTYDGHPGSDLLAVVSALRYAKTVGVPGDDYSRLLRRARMLVGSVVVTQRTDGGWSFKGHDHVSDWSISAPTFWALGVARAEGIAVNPDTIAKGKTFLLNAFRALEANHNDAKSVILHALSKDGAAEFANVNRLYRERNSLSNTALAYTALTFVNFKRNELAGELLDLLLTRSSVITRDGRTRRYWQYRKSSLRGAYRETDPIETTAVSLLVMLGVRSNAPQIREAVDHLLNARGCIGFAPRKARGPALAALAAYFSKGRYAETDARTRILVNGKVAGTIAARGERPLTSIRVPADLVVEGKNLVEFRVEGRGEYAYAATLRGFSPNLKDPRSFSYPYIQTRRYYHAPLEYRGRSIGVHSTSQVKNVEIGQRVRVQVDLKNSSSHPYLVIEENLPAGLVFVKGSLRSNWGEMRHEMVDGRLLLYFPPSVNVPDYSYELVGYSTGHYRILPTVIRNALKPGLIRVSDPKELIVLSPGEKSDDTYKLNPEERFHLGRLNFEDGRYPEALTHLTELRKSYRDYHERDVARMLLWIYTAKGFYDARSIVSVFEVLRERYPELEIPFDRILVVGRAYRDIGEFERAWLVYRATIDASFINDLNVSAVLEDEGQFLGSVKYQLELWRQYPDTAAVASSYFALSQSIFEKAPKAHELAKAERRLAEARGTVKEYEPPTRIGLLKETIRLLESFLAHYAKNPLADDAAFSLANAWLDLKQYERVVSLCEGFGKTWPESEFASGFQYMMALGHFWQHHHDLAFEAAKAVAEGKSKDKDFASYIAGQIQHAEGKPAAAIEWYSRVEDKYSDAKEAIRYFREKRISLEEVLVVAPGKDVELDVNYRNIKEVSLQVYRVDLMKLYLREKNLSNITKVHLAGIKPELTSAITLGDGKDYVDKEIVAKLNLTEEAAYLVICRGDDLFASGLVLITPLKIEVQEDKQSGRLRANLLDTVSGGYAPEVHVKAIGSADKEFRSGETDLRGIFVADGLRGRATVIARAGESRYAFYRGEDWIGAPEAMQPNQVLRPQGQPAQIDYLRNVRETNRQMQKGNFDSYDKMRRSKNKGVQVQEAK